MQLLIMKQDRKNHYKGDIVEIRATDTPFGGKEPEAFVLVEVPDVPMTDFEDKHLAWRREIAYEIVGQDQAQDGYRLRLYAENANAGVGDITKDEVERFIQAWGGTVHSFGPNEVVFDIRIYDALVSRGFWEIDVSNVVFNELGYDQNAGIHRIQADYSALGNNPTYVERYVRRMGLAIVSHAERVLVYDADRSIVRRAFEKDIAQKARTTVRRRRYHVSDAVVDYIIANGGYIVTDRATVEQYIKDKMTE